MQQKVRLYGKKVVNTEICCDNKTTLNALELSLLVLIQQSALVVLSSIWSETKSITAT